MSRTVRLAMASVLICILVAIALWFYLWDGAVDSRELAPGDQITVGNKLTFTVPVGWEGFYDRYVDVPSWLPLGAARPDLKFRESLTLRARTTEDAADVLLVQTYFRNQAPRGLAAMSRVAATDDVELYSSEQVLIAVAAGGERPVYLLGSAQGDATAQLRRLWGLLQVQGAEAP